MARGIYSHSGTRGGRTEPEQKRRTISTRATREHLAALYSMRDEVTGHIAEAEELRNVELLTQCETRLAFLNKSISQHESDLRAAEMGGAR